MKKFLAILLIAIVACSTVSVVEEEEFDLEKLPDWVKKGWSTLLKTFKKVVQFLKDNGLWDPLVKLLKESGKVAAKELCLKVYDEEFCDELLGSLLKKAENGEVELKSLRSWFKNFIKNIDKAITDALKWVDKKFGTPFTDLYEDLKRALGLEKGQDDQTK